MKKENHQEDVQTVLPNETEEKNIGEDHNEKKRKRRFTWTPARKAAFEKCVRANQERKKHKSPPADSQVDSVKNLPPSQLPKKVTLEESSSDSSETEDLSSDSDYEIVPRKKKRQKSSQKKLVREIQALKHAFLKQVKARKPKKVYIPNLDYISESEQEELEEQRPKRSQAKLSYTDYLPQPTFTFL